jgi:hypothetical protein
LCALPRGITLVKSSVMLLPLAYACALAARPVGVGMPACADHLRLATLRRDQQWRIDNVNATQPFVYSQSQMDPMQSQLLGARTTTTRGRVVARWQKAGLVVGSARAELLPR